MQRLCPRCRHAIAVEDEGSLAFCPFCGAPQVRISQEMLDQIASDREALETAQEAQLSGTAPVPPQPPAGAVDWPAAVRCAGLAGAIALGLTILAEPLPVVSLLALFWAAGAPVVTLGFYSARARQTVVRPGFGARLGLLSGLAVLSAMAIVNTVTLLLMRFVFHHAAPIDAPLDAFFTQMRAQVLQQGANAAAAGLPGLLEVPEFRAGLLLTFSGIFAAGYLLFSMAGGAFAGLLRSRTPASR